MTKYKQINNRETGKAEFHFSATLLKIGEAVLENTNEKPFKVVTLKFNLPEGKEVERTAMCYQSNYEYGIEVGKDYLCNLSFDKEGNAQIRMSHLCNTGRATTEDFSGLFQMSEQLIDDEAVI